VAGKRNVFFPELVEVTLYRFGSLTVTSVQLVIIAAAAVLMAGLYLLFNRTRTGLRIRAVSENRMAAELMGISTRAVLRRIFFIGPALGGAAGVLYGLYYGTAGYSMGYLVGIKAFVATVLGGIGSISGAMAGGLLLGIAENVGAGLLPVLTGGAVGPEYKDAFSFLILIIMLLVRPQGMFGERG